MIVLKKKEVWNSPSNTEKPKDVAQVYPMGLVAGGREWDIFFLLNCMVPEVFGSFGDLPHDF